MAKGNIFLGYARGSVGDITFQHLKGQQITKARNRHPNNPRTLAQVQQRVRLPQVVNAYHSYKAFLDHAFQDKGYRESDYNAFVKRNIMRAPFFGKEVNDSGYWINSPYVVSSGSLAVTTNILVPVEDEYVLTHSSLPEPYTSSAISRTSSAVALGVLTAGVTSLKWDAIRRSTNAQYGDMITIGFVAAPATPEITHASTASTGAFGYYQHIFTPETDNASVTSTSALDNAYNTTVEQASITADSSSTNAVLVTFRHPEQDGINLSSFVIISRASVGRLQLSTTIVYLPGYVYEQYDEFRTELALRTACQSYGYTSAPLLDPKNVEASREQAVFADVDIPEGSVDVLPETPKTTSRRGPRKQ